MIRIVTRLAILAACSAASAQDLVPAAPSQAEPIVLTGGDIHTIAGDIIERGAIRFDEGEVIDLGPAGEVDHAGARVIDVGGHRVYPGLVAARTQLGLIEISAVSATIDSYEIGSINPEVRSAVAVNPDSTLLPVARAGGVLLAGTFPNRGRIPGRAGVIRLDGWTWEDMTIDGDAGLVVNWPRVRPRDDAWTDKPDAKEREEITEALAHFNEFSDAAEAYNDAKDAGESIPTDLRLDAMRPFVRGETPLLIDANDYDQIVSAVSWCADRGYRCVILGGRDAALCAPMLIEHGVPVILDGTHAFPKRADQAHSAAYELPARLHEAGVDFCIGSSSRASNVRNLPHEAAMAARYGLPPAEAVRAITAAPARILGLGNRYGTLEPGKSATLIVADGDILEITTRVAHAFIDGREIDLSNKQTELRDKYIEKYRQKSLLTETD